MAEKKNPILHPRKLNLNVPPLSTRRPSVDPCNDEMLMLSKSSITNMVPFSWERIPGEPKDRNTNDDLDLPPPPKPPPGWRLQPPDHQCDDVDSGDGKEYGHDDRFSDAIDIFSLADSIDDDVEVNCKATQGGSSPNNGYGSHNFIIQRFLPDARALAEASVMNKKLSYSSSSESNSSFSRAVSIRRSHDSPKGCGLGSFLPWRMRPKPCRVKSPVCDTIIGANLKHKR